MFTPISELWSANRDSSHILIDIPIGMRETGPDERICDKLARKLLGSKGSSVFRVPTRQAVYSKSYENASIMNEEITDKRLSKQTWSIIPKIKEVDILLTTDALAKDKIREIHPEICFWALNKKQPMFYKKNLPDGFADRLNLLQSVLSPTRDIVYYSLKNYLRKHVAKDDILDALSAAVTAFLGHHGGHKTLPEAPETGPKGLRMEMLYTLL